MKLFCLINNTSKDKAISALKEAREIIQSKLNINFDYHFEFVNEPLIYTKLFNKWMLPKNYTAKWNVEAKGCHSIIYFYETDLDINKIFNVSYLEDERPNCQVLLEGSKLGEITAHELAHNFFLNLRTKGIHLNDQLDDKGDRLELLLQNLEKFKGYEDKLNKPLPVDTKINTLLTIRDTLRTFINYMKGLRPLTQLGLAMSKMEGYNIVGSRAYRNNNPLNIKYMGQSLAIGNDDKNFAIFENSEDGWETCYKDLKLKIEGKSITGLSGNSTIKDLIWSWSETDREDYLKFVCKELSIKPTFQIKNFLYD